MEKTETKIANNLKELAKLLRESPKKYNIIFAHNGTGKTRLSTAFKNHSKYEEGRGDTLYYNAFTEDLFTWDNDLDNDIERGIIYNASSHFFDGLNGSSISSKIHFFLDRLVTFNFNIDDSKQRITFSRNVKKLRIIEGEEKEIIENVDNIKISRGEENIFIWCFFLAIAQMAIDNDDNYKWVKYIYVDDPVSSLDDNNAVDIACLLAQLIRREDNKIKTIMSTHHGLFFNVLCNELGSANVFFLNKLNNNKGYSLISMRDTPFFHHVVIYHTLKKAVLSEKLYTYHFNILRTLLEKTAAFLGYSDFKQLIKQGKDDPDGLIRIRKIQILNHGNYSIFTPIEMQDENKKYFKEIFHDYETTYHFNKSLIEELDKE